MLEKSYKAALKGFMNLAQGPERPGNVPRAYDCQ